MQYNLNTSNHSTHEQTKLNGIYYNNMKKIVPEKIVLKAGSQYDAVTSVVL